MSDAGIPVGAEDRVKAFLDSVLSTSPGLSYRVRHTLGLMLFDHTQVQCVALEGCRVTWS